MGGGICKKKQYARNFNGYDEINATLARTMPSGVTN